VVIVGRAAVMSNGRIRVWEFGLDATLVGDGPEHGSVTSHFTRREKWLCGPRWLSRNSDSLRAGRSGDPVPDESYHRH
jgi:hypothetical protein